MRIVQMLPSLAYGDAIGNDTVALKKSLEEQGYDTAIYAKYIDGSTGSIKNASYE